MKTILNQLDSSCQNLTPPYYSYPQPPPSPPEKLPSTDGTSEKGKNPPAKICWELTQNNLLSINWSDSSNYSIHSLILLLIMFDIKYRLFPVCNYTIQNEARPRILTLDWNKMKNIFTIKVKLGLLSPLLDLNSKRRLKLYWFVWITNDENKSLE